MGSTAETSEPVGSLRIDESEWPMVVVTFGGGRVAAGDWRSLITTLERVVQRGEPFGLLVDARRGVSVDASQRREAADYLRRHEHQLRRFCRGLVTVSDSALVRGLITAVGWIFPPPCPDRVEGDLASGRSWLERQLKG